MIHIPKSKVNGKMHLLPSALEVDPIEKDFERMSLQITEKLFCAGVGICSVFAEKVGSTCGFLTFKLSFCNAFFPRSCFLNFFSYWLLPHLGWAPSFSRGIVDLLIMQTL